MRNMCRQFFYLLIRIKNRVGNNNELVYKCEYQLFHDLLCIFMIIGDGKS